MTAFSSRDLPKYREWSESFEPASDQFNYVRRHVSATAAFLLLEIMLPKFIIVRGCVIRESQFDAPNFEQWWTTCSGDRRAVESVINELHLWELFNGGPDEYDESDYRALENLAPRIADAWRAIAADQFPDRKFKIEVGNEYGPTISFISDEQDLIA